MLISKEKPQDDDSFYEAGIGIRLLYSLAVVSFFPLTIIGSSGWVGLATGSGASSRWVLLLLLVIGAWRVFCVWRHPTTLAVPARTAGVGMLRWLGLLLMFISVLAALSVLFQRPLVSVLFQGRSNNGIEFFVMSLFAALLGIVSAKGVLFFELSRLMSFEHWRHSSVSNYSSAQSDEMQNENNFPENKEPLVVVALYGMVMFVAIVYSVWSVLAFSDAGRFPLAILIPGIATLLFYLARLYSLMRWRDGFVRWSSMSLSWLRIAGLVSCMLMVFSWIAWLLVSRNPVWTDDPSTRIRLLRALGLLTVVLGYSWLLFDFSRLLGFEFLVRRNGFNSPNHESSRKVA